jgi:hypothetical protein
MKATSLGARTMVARCPADSSWKSGIDNNLTSRLGTIDLGEEIRSKETGFPMTLLQDKTPEWLASSRHARCQNEQGGWGNRENVIIKRPSLACG